MKILFHTLYYPPEIGAAPSRTRELACKLRDLGHEVTILTGFPNYPTGIVPPEYRGHAWMKEVEDGVLVCRTWAVPASTKRFLRRVVGDVSFSVSTIVASFALGKPDVVIVESHPLFSGNAGALIARLKGVPSVLNVSDLWPDVAIEMGKLKNPAFIWLARVMENFLYHRSTLILAMSAGILEKIRAHGISSDKLLLFRAAVEPELFKPHSEAADIRQKLGLGADTFVVIYAGTLGSGNNLWPIIDAAALFNKAQNDSVHFVFAGEGSEKDKLQAQAKREGLRNVSFLDPVPKSAVPKMLSSANCVVVSMTNQRVFHSVLPRKMFEAMACARPIVIAANGEAKEIVRSAGAGMCVTPERPEEIYDAILYLCKNRAEAAAMGERGRKLIREHFTTEHRARQLDERLQVLGA